MNKQELHDAVDAILARLDMQIPIKDGPGYQYLDDVVLALENAELLDGVELPKDLQAYARRFLQEQGEQVENAVGSAMMEAISDLLLPWLSRQISAKMTGL